MMSLVLEHVENFEISTTCLEDKDSASELHVLNYLAEGVGFGPTEPFGSPVFKTGLVNHLSTLPYVGMEGLEPPRLSALHPKCSAATSYATSPLISII